MKTSTRKNNVRLPIQWAFISLAESNLRVMQFNLRKTTNEVQVMVETNVIKIFDAVLNVQYRIPLGRPYHRFWQLFYTCCHHGR